MTAPKFLYQITKEFKDQTNKRFSNLATTIKITKIHLMSYNNEKWSHATVNSSDVRSDRRSRSWTTTVHDTKDLGNCPLTTAPNNELVPENECPRSRTGSKQLTSVLTAPRRLSAMVSDQRQHSPMTNKRL